ncbi:MAG: DUF302 domain-containing protein [Silicimonas sp.]|jgi:uncharacterized protein (DUF302 family)|nr:DUF302 domain-containing protein [Silicimonas sp.]
MKTSCIAALALALPVTALAQDAVTAPFDGSFDDATFAVETAIVGQGLVIDYVSHVGEMLARTGADVGSDRELFKAADVFLFCSAVVSREVMEADPMNLAHCPYGVFVAETDAGVMIGRRDYPAGAMDRVEALLDAIIAEAVAN